jgi:hypothetical protein
MKHKLRNILIVLIIFNLIVGAFLILDIQAFESPRTSVQVNIVDVTSEEMILETIVNIENPNSFDLSVNNFKVVSNTEDGAEIGKIVIDGGDISPQETREFSSQDSFVLKNENITVLKNKVTAKVGLKFFGILQKTIPLDIDIETSLKEVIEQIGQPDIKIQADLTEIYEKGLNFTTQIEIYNPTHLLYRVEEINFDIEKEDGTNVGNIVLYGDDIEPKKSITLVSDGTIFFDALDAKTLWLRLTGVAGLKIAGIYKSIDLSAEAAIIVPDVKDFVFGNESIDFQIPVQFKLTLNGILSNVGFNMYNPSNVSLVGTDLLCSIYRLDGEKQSLLGEKVMQACTLPPQKRVCVKTDITIPYRTFFSSGNGKILPDWIILSIEGDFHIAGTRQTVPISLNAFVDPNVFTQKDMI